MSKLNKEIEKYCRTNLSKDKQVSVGQLVARGIILLFLMLSLLLALNWILT